MGTLVNNEDPDEMPHNAALSVLHRNFKIGNTIRVSSI